MRRRFKLNGEREGDEKVIIREDDHAFVMIEQNHHAHLSAAIISQWKSYFLADDPFQASVLYAIKHHDCGWRYFDQQPFLNDDVDAPYSFLDFPELAKIVLYTQGVNDVETHDPYAAVLCSAHYAQFISPAQQDDIRYYLKQEEERRKRILSTLSAAQLNVFKKHLALLQLADNLSLYMCLNAPGVSKRNEHPFFKKEIPFARESQVTNQNSVKARWKNEQTIVLQGLPYVESFSVTLEEKRVLKQAIKEHGLRSSYENASHVKTEIHFQLES